MIWPILQFIFSAGMIFIAARWLTRASDAIARITRLGHFLVGGLFLAASTSAPEFFVDIHATLQGAPNLAAGDLLGSSIINLLILSLCILVFNKRIPDKLQNITWPAILSIVLTIVVALAIVIPQPQLWGIGAGSYVIVTVYILGLKLLFRLSVPLIIDQPKVPPSPRRLLVKPVLLFLAASVLLFFMAPILVSSVSTLCHILEIDHTFMGSTLLALTTSFPELFTSIFAARMGLFDLVLGNIVGSNAFNMIIFAFMDLAWQDGPLWSHFSKSHIIAASAVVLNMALLIFANRFLARKRALLLMAVLILISSSICYVLLYSS